MTKRQSFKLMNPKHCLWLSRRKSTAREAERIHRRYFYRYHRQLADFESGKLDSLHPREVFAAMRVRFGYGSVKLR